MHNLEVNKTPEKRDSIFYCKLSIWINVLITKGAAKRFIKRAPSSLSKYLARLTEAISVSVVVACTLKTTRISKKWETPAK